MEQQNYFNIFEFSNKQRLGEKGDGGYVIGVIENDPYDCYISCGVSNEESFSRDFINKYNMNAHNSFAFDGTIVDYPYHYTNKITFINKNIGGHNDNFVTNLSFLTEKYNNIFLKMDIEGGEYPWLLQINEKDLSKFKQIVIELHGVNDNSWGETYLNKMRCLNKVNSTHYLIHLHGNNHSGMTNGIPNVLEATFINKNYFTQVLRLDNTIYPIPGLDFVNNVFKPELEMNFLNKICFDWQSYVNFYPDLSFITTQDTAWSHWIHFGRHEKRQYFSNEFPSFDWQKYVNRYPDLSFITTQDTAWSHWIHWGKPEGRH